MFGSRSRSHIMRQAELHRMRRIIRELVDMLPEDEKNSPRAKELAGWSCRTTMHLVEINARPIKGDTNAREFDFSRAAVRARWAAGYADTCKMLKERPWDAAIDPATNLTVSSLRRAGTDLRHSLQSDLKNHRLSRCPGSLRFSGALREYAATRTGRFFRSGSPIGGP